MSKERDELIELLARMTTPTDGVTDEDEASDIMADLDDETLCSDASALYDLIREARKIVTKPYTVEVRYRTNSGCNTAIVTVDASSVEQAFELAGAKVRKRRGVVRVDGGYWREDTRHGWEEGGK